MKKKMKQEKSKGRKGQTFFNETRIHKKKTKKPINNSKKKSWNIQTNKNVLGTKPKKEKETRGVDMWNFSPFFRSSRDKK